jgi:hypothetical protein
VEGLRKRLEKDIEGVLPPEQARTFVGALPGAPVPAGAASPPFRGGENGISR